MRSVRIIPAFISALIIIFLYGCPQTIELPGDITGIVTDAESSEPIQEAFVELNQSINTITDSTGNDGSYLLRNLSPGNYEIQASKLTYGEATKNVTVISAQTTEINFELSGQPTIELSDNYLDYGLDITIKSFTISNIGTGKLRYSLLPNKDWITVNSANGEVTTETDTIEVSIDRSGLSEDTHEESIIITYYVGEVRKEVQVGVLVNGVMGLLEEQYYRIVKIGTQTWMAENLNTGIKINLKPNYQTDLVKNDSIIAKFCYDDLEINCDIYGGLYTWYEALDYPPPYPHDMIGIHQGICPDGWHIPSGGEAVTLINFLGGEYSAGGKLKDTGNLQDGTGLWEYPNTDATNESGFKALPGGAIWAPEGYIFDQKGEAFWAWTTGRTDLDGWIGYLAWWLKNIDGISHAYWIYSSEAVSVRCIKDPE